jgi:hypothetical protein
MGLGGLHGFFKKDRSTQQLLDMVAAYSSPQRILGDATDYYRGFLGSPAYSSARAGINMSANRTAGQFANDASARGLTGTGIGSAQMALGANTAGLQLGNLQSQAWMSALQNASNIASGRLQGAGYLKGPRDISGDTEGAFLDWLGKQDVTKWGGQKKVTGNSMSAGWGGGGGMDAGNPMSYFAQLMGTPMGGPPVRYNPTGRFRF